MLDEIRKVTDDASGETSHLKRICLAEVHRAPLDFHHFGLAITTIIKMQ